MSDKDGDTGRMGNSERVLIIRSNRDRRSRMERRQFSYAGHIPERRIGQERRNGPDRRNSELIS